MPNSAHATKPTRQPDITAIQVRRGLSLVSMPHQVIHAGRMFFTVNLDTGSELRVPPGRMSRTRDRQKVTGPYFVGLAVLDPQSAPLVFSDN